ncbi:MAG: tetratricopeptide repeat protein [Rhodoplanes sp.]
MPEGAQGLAVVLTDRPKSRITRGVEATDRQFYYRGEYDKAERIQREALALNPNDPETLAQLGCRLAFRGRWQEGLGYLARAMDRSISPPAWYHTSFAMHAYLEGKYAEALAYAAKSRPSDSGIGLSLYATTQAAMGDEGEARKALDELAARVPYFLRDPAGAYRVHHIDESIIERLVDGCARPAGKNRTRRPRPEEKDEKWPRRRRRSRASPTGTYYRD